MNIAYFGSPEISAELLSNLLSKNDPDLRIICVFTQPDRPVGKKLSITPTPVKKVAQEHTLPTFDKSLKENEKEAMAMLTLHEIDLCIVYAYGEIISENMLSIPSEGYINVHPSNLPKYRGPTPVAYTLMLGETKATVALIKLVKKMDAGPIIGTVQTDIFPHENRAQLEKRLTQLATHLTIETIHAIENHNLEETQQKEKEATYTALFKKEHGFIPWQTLQKVLQNELVSPSDYPPLLKEYLSKYSKSEHLKHLSTGEIYYNYFRALSPWPGLWTIVPTTKGEKRLKLIDVELQNGSFHPLKVQLEGKTEVPYSTFKKAYSL